MRDFVRLGGIYEAVTVMKQVLYLCSDFKIREPFSFLQITSLLEKTSTKTQHMLVLLVCFGAGFSSRDSRGSVLNMKLKD